MVSSFITTKTFLRFWCPAIVVNTGLSSVISETVIVEIYLCNTFLEHRDHIIERAEAVGVDRTARVGPRDGNNCIIPKWIVHQFFIVSQIEMAITYTRKRICRVGL